jgi:predicted AlkP superfamily pyrophosphatase or phosphodiesterase
MPANTRRSLPWLFVLLLLASSAFASAYDARPKLIVVITVDQLRADLLQRHKAKFTDGGFRLLMDRGAYFTDCYYNYVNLHTAPGHATLFTGAYTDSHNIIGNEWWNHERKRVVTSVDDFDTKVVGGAGDFGASPHNLTATTIGDELREATDGKARVFGISLKDRSAILPAGHSGIAYWIDRKDGTWVTSTYYMQQLPQWAAEFNGQKRADKYWNLEWKDAAGKPHVPKLDPAKPDFYNQIGGSPFGIAYELEFARELFTNEKLGSGESTDLLSISISSTDITGHNYGPDAPEQEAMVLATDKALNEFFGFLGRQVGFANLWIVLSADHGVAPTVAQAQKLKLPAANMNGDAAKQEINAQLAQRLGRKAEYVATIRDRNVYLNQEAFGPNAKRTDTEAMVAEIMRTPTVKQKLGILDAVTQEQITSGRMPDNELTHKWAHSFAPQLDEWYVMGLPGLMTEPTYVASDHLAPWAYDTHVPLGFYGVPFVPGTYRKAVEPVDWSVTLASLLGINKPSHAVGRVLTEAIKETARESGKKEQQ